MIYTSTLPIYIGYEAREHEAYKTCRYSINVHKTSFTTTHQLRSIDIEEYDRDLGEPQSTDFTFTRFWVPYLSNYSGFSIFVDCDFLFLDDPMRVMRHVDPRHAVSVVQHPPYDPIDITKMDGISQHRSYRKNWASFMVFNNAHPANKILTPKYLNEHAPGLDFHHLKWLDDGDIGSLPLEWNCLDQYYHLENPKAIHYTEGGPWFGKKFEKTRYGPLWVDYNVKRNFKYE